MNLHGISLVVDGRLLINNHLVTLSFACPTCTLAIYHSWMVLDTLRGTNISPKNGILEMIFLFPRWDMLIPWRVLYRVQLEVHADKNLRNQSSRPIKAELFVFLLGIITRWWFSNIFYFHPYLGKWSNLTNIFQMGWNHQLDKRAIYFRMIPFPSKSHH